MASHLLLVLEPPNDRRGRLPAEGQARMDRMVRWGESLASRGLLEGANSLRTDHDAVRVKVRDGRRSLLDGPFAEAKEMIGGYFVLNCESREHAVKIAEECPAAEWATIEVREIGTCAE